MPDHILNLPLKSIDTVLTDIDDTLSENGQISAKVFESLEHLHNQGIRVVPVTGRPAGWCDMIARTWPVDGVIGENGAFYFRMAKKAGQHRMIQRFLASKSDRQKLETIKTEVLQTYPKAALASDQFARLYDLAIDFCEDVPALTQNEVQGIVDIFKKHGAQAKVSSIHVNGWFGNHDKKSAALTYLSDELSLTTDTEQQKRCLFIGDSPNDEPMFAHFNNSVAVANFSRFQNSVTHQPKFITTAKFGEGFCELAEALLSSSQT